VEEAGVDLADQFAGLNVPVLDHTLQISGNQTLTVRVERNVIDVTVVTEHFLVKLPSCIRLPDPDGAVVSDTGDELPVGTDRNFAD
jgi:hypothetical protein